MSRRRRRAGDCSRITEIICSFRMADRFLLVMMSLLMMQSAHNLFCPELTGGEPELFEASIRATAAALFGYFISAGFRGAREKTADIVDLSDPEAPEAEASPTPPENETVPTRASGGAPPDVIRRTSEPCMCDLIRQQEVIVAIIGTVSLVMLIAAERFGEVSQTDVATVTQLRDFVSGSVGFLIGHSSDA